MSSEDIATVRRVFEALARRDLDGMAGDLAEEFAFNPLMSVWRRTYIGAAGVAEWWGDLDELWSVFEVELVAVRDISDGVVVVTGHWHGEPRASLVPIDAPVHGVVRTAAGKLVSADMYLNEEQALVAAEGA